MFNSSFLMYHLLNYVVNFIIGEYCYVEAFVPRINVVDLRCFFKINIPLQNFNMMEFVDVFK